MDAEYERKLRELDEFERRRRELKRQEENRGKTPNMDRMPLGCWLWLGVVGALAVLLLKEFGVL